MNIYEHTFSTPAIALALLTALLLGAFSFWRFLPRSKSGAGLLALYLLTLLGVGWCLFLPTKKNVVTQLIKPRFLIALDTSKSMSLSPAQGLPDRWTKAIEALKRPWLEKIGEECEIEIYPFSSDLGDSVPLATALELKPQGNTTLLRNSLKQLADRFAGLNVAGMLLLSDGLDTHEVLDDWAEVERPFPVYTVRLEPPGGWQQEPDLHLDSLTTARRVSVGWKSEFKVKISGQGTRGAPITVQVYENGKLLAEKPTQIPDEGGERELVFELEHPQIGMFQYRAVVTPLPGEKNKSDNENSLEVEVVDARNRLLYVEGTPRWEYKYLRRALLAEREISPVLFFTGPDGKPQTGTPVKDFTAGMTPSELSMFKIVILGNLTADELGPQRAASLVKFVENGGSLVLLGGTKAWARGGLLNTELSKILPFRATELKVLSGETPFPVKLTNEARGHPAFAGDASLWQNVPPVLSVFAGGSLSPSAQVLVLTETPSGPQPVVVAQRFGQGKVAAILTDSLWRWQLGPEAERTRPYERFWTQMVSWLLPREEALGQMRLELFADRDQLYLGETVELRARLGGENTPQPKSLEAQITLPNGRELPFRMEPQQVTTSLGKTFPGFALSLNAENAGTHKVVVSANVNGSTVTSQPLSFFVKPYSPESAPRPAKIEVLQTLAKATDGQFYDNLDRMDEGLSSLRLKASEESNSEYKTLWRHWPILVAIMVLLALSWGLRKSRNMP